MKARSAAFVLLAWFAYCPAVAYARAAEHSGPKGFFPNSNPSEVVNTIEKACLERGFSITRAGPTDITCQGGELNRKQIIFSPIGAAADPAKVPQMYHRFVASSNGADVAVSERTTITIPFQGKVVPFVPSGKWSQLINERLVEFYRGLLPSPSI